MIKEFHEADRLELLNQIDVYFPSIRCHDALVEHDGALQRIKVMYESIIRIKRGGVYYEVPIISRYECDGSPKQIHNLMGLFYKECYMLLRMWMVDGSEVESVSQIEETERLMLQIAGRNALMRHKAHGLDTIAEDDHKAAWKGGDQ